MASLSRELGSQTGMLWSLIKLSLIVDSTRAVARALVRSFRGLYGVLSFFSYTSVRVRYV